MLLNRPGVFDIGNEALFERGHDRLQIVGAGRETVQLAGWELSRDGGQR